MFESYSCFCEPYLMCRCATLHQAICKCFYLSEIVLNICSAHSSLHCNSFFIVCELSHMTFNTHTHTHK